MFLLISLQSFVSVSASVPVSNTFSDSQPALPSLRFMLLISNLAAKLTYQLQQQQQHNMSTFGCRPLNVINSFSLKALSNGLKLMLFLLLLLFQPPILLFSLQLYFYRFKSDYLTSSCCCCCCCCWTSKHSNCSSCSTFTEQLLVFHPCSLHKTCLLL